jgi:hypothetical protein
MVSIDSIAGGIAGGATIAIVIKAIDEFSKTFNDVEKSTVTLNKQMLAAGTAITAMGVAGTIAISSLALEAGKAQGVISAYNNMLGNDSVIALNKLNEVTHNTVSNIEIMRQANQALLLGIDPEALPAMFEGAYAAAKATGRPVADAIADITTGIGRQSRMILDNLGIIVNVEKANENYAASIGKLSKDLTDAERKTAFMNETMNALKVNADKIGVTEENLADKSAQMAKAWDDARLQLGTALIPVMQFFIENIISPMTNFFAAHPIITKWAAVILVAGTALALIIGPALILIALLPAIAAGIGMITAVSLPWLLIGAAIVAGIVALIAIFLYWQDIITFLKENILIPFWDWLQKKFGPEIAVISELVRLMGLAFIQFKDSFLKPVWDFMVEFYNWIKDSFLSIVDRLVSALNSVSSAVSSAKNMVSSTINAARETASNAIVTQTKKVNDFILQPNGRLIETNPNDTIFGTKNTSSLGGSNNITVIIEGNIYGTDPDEMAEALYDKLRRKISF